MLGTGCPRAILLVLSENASGLQHTMRCTTIRSTHGIRFLYVLYVAMDVHLLTAVDWRVVLFVIRHDLT